MKKLFVSCPMRDRTEEEIRASINKMHKLAEVALGEKLEVIPSYRPDQGYNDKPIYCLGHTIKLMQDADYFIGLQYSDEWRGCSVESYVAHRYMPLDNVYEIPTKLIISYDEYKRLMGMRSHDVVCK